jgi:hypothetical protein
MAQMDVIDALFMFTMLTTLTLDMVMFDNLYVPFVSRGPLRSLVLDSTSFDDWICSYFFTICSWQNQIIYFIIC